MSHPLPFAEKLVTPCLWTPDSSDHPGVININKKDIPQRRNVKYVHYYIKIYIHINYNCPGVPCLLVLSQRQKPCHSVSIKDMQVNSLYPSCK